MKSKRHKGKTCVYCGAIGASDTADHVIARQFLPVEHRGNLPKVPACTPCNGAKADLERYLSAVLPFGGRHPASSRILNNEVPRRLAGNVRLHRELALGSRDAWIAENGLTRPSMTLPFDGAKLEALFVLITRGLAYHHFDTVIPQYHFIGAGVLAHVAQPVMEGLLSLEANKVSISIGDGLFDYDGSQSRHDPNLTIWRYRMYGGIMFTDADHLDEAPTTIWASSSRLKEQSVFSL